MFCRLATVCLICVSVIIGVEGEGPPAVFPLRMLWLSLPYVVVSCVVMLVKGRYLRTGFACCFSL